MAIPLRQIPLQDLPNLPLPAHKIRTDADVHTWKSTQGYKDYAAFVGIVNECVVGVHMPWDDEGVGCCEVVTKILQLLDTLDAWIDDIPPQPTPQRFGNLAFRTWGKRLQDTLPSLIQSILPQHLPAQTKSLLIQHLSPYLLTSFGSFVRMDYGTGHELAFALFLCTLSLIRVFPFPLPAKSSPSPTSSPPPSPSPEEDLTKTQRLSRAIAFLIYPRYLHLTWRLQDRYNLEPAGSHGVWGLDDSSFLGYIWGSGQLRDSSTSPTSILLPSTPSPSSHTHPDPAPTRASLPPTNLYNILINRIHQIKTGPFHEHSSQLYSIAVGVKGWGKVNSGLGKMYEAEVLGKRVVVQHIPLGGLLEWDAAATSTSPANTNINTENTTTPTTPIRTTTAQMSTSHLETLAHAQTRTTRIQPRSKAQGQGRGTPPALTTTTARVPWATTAPGGRSEATRAPWAAAMPMGTVTDSSGHCSSSGSGSMGPPRSPGMDIGG